MNKTLFVVIALAVGTGLGMFLIPISAAAQTTSAQDIAVLNSQLEKMEIALIELQKTAALKNALDNLQAVLEQMEIKLQNNELSLENQKILNETLAGIKINLAAINSNYKNKNLAVASKKSVIPTASENKSLQPISSIPTFETQTIAKQETKENLPLIASVESTTLKGFGITSLIISIILAITGYFVWTEKEFLTTLLKKKNPLS